MTSGMARKRACTYDFKILLLGAISSYGFWIDCAMVCDNQRLMEAMSRSDRYSWPGISVPGMPNQKCELREDEEIDIRDRDKAGALPSETAALSCSHGQATLDAGQSPGLRRRLRPQPRRGQPSSLERVHEYLCNDEGGNTRARESCQEPYGSEFGAGVSVIGEKCPIEHARPTDRTKAHEELKASARKLVSR